MAGPTARDFLDLALKRKAELSAESEALDQIIETYKRLLRPQVADVNVSSDQPDLYRGATPRAIQAARVAEMIDAARRLIIAEKRPMKRGELVKRLAAQGYEVVGKDRNKVFGTNLWRSGRFVAVEGQGYWPSDLELPA